MEALSREPATHLRSNLNKIDSAPLHYSLSQQISKLPLQAENLSIKFCFVPRTQKAGFTVRGGSVCISVHNFGI